MKKAMIYGLSAALLLVSLTACGKPQDTRQTDQSEPPQAAASTPAAEPASTQDPEIGLIADQQEKQLPTQEELLLYFSVVYESTVPILDEGGDIDLEVSMVENMIEVDNKLVPSDLREQYVAWRPVVEEATFNFTEVNEQVWATGAVNLRSGPSTSNDKVGSLAKNQQATRTGIGQDSEAGWSRLQLADGSEVYVNSTYISATKPADESKPSQNQNKTPTQQQQTSSSSSQQQTTKPSGGSSKYNGYSSYDEMINAMHTQRPDLSIEYLKQHFPNPDEGYVDPVAEIAAEKGLLG